MKKWIKIFLIIELQVVLLLLIVLLYDTNSLEQKTFNTNKFVHEALIDKRIKTLNTIHDKDIVIGNSDACVTMYVYSRFDCPACSDFFSENYVLLKRNFIDNGHLKLVIRYLVHPSKPNTLYATKGAHYTYDLGQIDSYIKQVNNHFPVLDVSIIKSIVLNLDNSKNTFSNFLNDKTIEKDLLQSANTIRDTEILSTPTMFINNQRLIGNHNYKRLERVILSELKNNACK